MSTRLTDDEYMALDYAYCATDCRFEDVVQTVEGIVAARLAAAWDEGYDEGQADEVRRVYPDIGRRSNPYRAAVAADTGR